MTGPAKKLLNEAMKLSVAERTALIEGLVESLDKPNPALDALWLKEAESRIAAYRVGEISALDAEQVFSDLGQKI